MSDEVDPVVEREEVQRAKEKARGPRRLVVYLPLLLFAGLAVLFLLRLGDSGNIRKLPSALIGRPVPDFSLPPLEGVMRDGVQLPGLATADLKPGGGVATLVNVWASWCVPCRQEHPVLMKLAEEGSVRVVGINYKDRAENARRFIDELGNPYSAVGVDSKGRVSIDWGVYGVPETYLVDGEGVIRFKYVGPLTDRVVERMLRPALEKIGGGTEPK